VVSGRRSVVNLPLTKTIAKNKMLAFIGQKIRASQIRAFQIKKVPSRLLTWDFSFKQRFTFGFGSQGAKSLSVIMLIMLQANLIKSSIYLWQEILN
jgi:hypothetical protein